MALIGTHDAKVRVTQLPLVWKGSEREEEVGEAEGAEEVHMYECAVVGVRFGAESRELRSYA